jgi:sarcosine oxidase, subunit beta
MTRSQVFSLCGGYKGATNVRHLRVEHGEALPAEAEVVIIGGGIVGVASAVLLGERGVTPLLIDAASGLGTRTTAMSAHCIRAQFGEPDNIAMMAESLAFYEAFAIRLGLSSRSNPISLCQQGYLFASTNPADADVFAERIERQRAAGLEDVELLDGDEARARYPWLSEAICVATFRARDGWIDSARAVEAMAAAASGSFALETTVEEIVVNGGRVTGVRTNRGTIDTDTVVLAAGPFSRNLSPEPLPIQLWRRHRVIVSPHPVIPQGGPVTIDANTGAHWRPHLGGALAAWALLETDQPATWPVTPDPSFPDHVLLSADGIGRLAPFWRDLAPALTPAGIMLTAGQYTMTPDHRPLIGPAPQTRGLFLHTGYSGHGIMGAPAGARILADSVTGAPGRNPFDPSRFADGVSHPDVEPVVI